MENEQNPNGFAEAEAKAWAKFGKTSEDAKLVQIYLKIGLYCGWSWQEFYDTPWDIVDEIANHLKTVFEDPKEPLNYQEIATARGIGRAFGGK